MDLIWPSALNCFASLSVAFTEPVMGWTQNTIIHIWQKKLNRPPRSMLDNRSAYNAAIAARHLNSRSNQSLSYEAWPAFNQQHRRNNRSTLKSE